MKRTLLLIPFAAIALICAVPLTASGSAAKAHVKAPFAALPPEIRLSSDRIFKPTVVAGAGQQVKAFATAGVVVKLGKGNELRYELRPAKAKIGAGESKPLELRLPGSKDKRRRETHKLIKAIRGGGNGKLYVEVELTGKGGASSRLTPESKLTA